MEENVISKVEQPQEQDVALHPDLSNNLQETSGSTFGKFKDATSLLSAYNELQAEFTRKSQKLSETLKQLERTQEIAASANNLAQENNEGSTENIHSDASTENKFPTWAPSRNMPGSTSAIPIFPNSSRMC